MTGSRLVALLLAACALAATALMAIPVESFEALGSGYLARSSAPAPDPKLAPVAPHDQASRSADPADHAAVPRLWLR
jgi:hypothetical protein